MITETQRLYLREITIADAENAYLLNIDPEVIQYTGDEAFESIEEAREFLSGYDHYQKYGFGRWGVIRKQDNVFLGWCGLKYTEDLNEYDIGFRLSKKYWNQGYATEAAVECLKLGFERFGMKTIVGRVMTKNKASSRVLEKIGLSLYQQFDFDGEDGLVYKIDDHEYFNRQNQFL